MSPSARFLTFCAHLSRRLAKANVRCSKRERSETWRPERLPTECSARRFLQQAVRHRRPRGEERIACSSHRRVFVQTQRPEPKEAQRNLVLVHHQRHGLCVVSSFVFIAVFLLFIISQSAMSKEDFFVALRFISIAQSLPDLPLTPATFQSLAQYGSNLFFFFFVFILLTSCLFRVAVACVRRVVVGKARHCCPARLCCCWCHGRRRFFFLHLYCFLRTL